MNYGAKVINRNESLAGDMVTLDPVIYDALIRCEKENNCSYDLIITMQPTSPLTTVKTLDAAIQKFLDEHYNTLLSVVNKPHLSWTEKEGRVLPAYEKRLNRQQLPKNFLETGAFVIVDRKSISENSRFGEIVGVFEVPEREAIDIDDATDWIMTESLMKKKKILFFNSVSNLILTNHDYSIFFFSSEHISVPSSRHIEFLIPFHATIQVFLFQNCFHCSPRNTHQSLNF